MPSFIYEVLLEIESRGSLSKFWTIFAIFTSELAGALLLFATIDKFGRVKCAVLSYLLVAVFLIPVALEASGTFVWFYPV